MSVVAFDSDFWLFGPLLLRCNAMTRTILLPSLLPPALFASALIGDVFGSALSLSFDKARVPSASTVR